MNETTQENQLAVIADADKPLAARVDGLRKLMMMNKDKLSIGSAGLLQPERMIQVACLSIRKNPELLECTVPSLFGALSEAATYGWVCDGIMGQASLVPFKNTKKNCKEATLIPGYKGLRDLVSRSGRCETIMESVHVGDTFEFKSQFELPIHTRSKQPDRKFQPVTHAYVVGQFPGGIIKVFCWTVDECKAHRDRYSQSWRRVAGKKWPDGNPKDEDSPWNERNPAFRVMCMKSVMLDAIHRGEFPMSVEDKRIASRDAEVAAVASSTVVAPQDSLLEFDDTDGNAETVSGDTTGDVVDVNADSDEDLALTQLIEETVDSINNCKEADLINRIADTATAAVKERGGNPELIESARQVCLQNLKPKGKATKQKDFV